MAENINKEQTTTHKLGIYLWIWGLLFVLSFFSYMVDWLQFEGLLRWTLILIFMFLKAGLIKGYSNTDRIILIFNTNRLVLII